MMKFSAVAVRILAAGLLTAVAGAGIAQQAYPSKPIRLITPYAPGGSTSTVARLIGQKLIESWGQPVIVENRPGGNTIIGTDAVAKAPPDGYTILWAVSSHVLIPQLMPAPYDAIKDFAPVATIGSSELVLVLNPSVPANSVQELIALAKSRPGQLNFASSSSGSVVHLAGELFNIMAGVKTQHIPYKGAGPAMTDLIGGQVQMFFAVATSAIPYIKTGRLKAIAIGGETRTPALPQVPTFSEAGLPGFNMRSWHGVVATAGTPQEIIHKLSTEITRIVTLPDTKEKLVSQGMDPFISTPEQLAVLMKADFAKYAKIIKAANIKLEN